jgi:hypothetical protein
MYIRLIPHYIFWHYRSGIHDYLTVMHRLLQAVARIFSLRLMFKTFFEPFERLGEHYRGGGVSAFFEAIVVNTLMRMVGIVVRFCVIVVGSMAWLCALIFSVAGIIIWIVLPLLPLLFLYVSVLNLIKVL